MSGPEAGPEVLVERREDGVALITLNRPKANALSIGMLGLLAKSISDLSADPPGALVLWGGERIFAAGADVTELSQPGAAGTVSDAFKAVTDALEKLGCPTIAAISRLRARRRARAGTRVRLQGGLDDFTPRSARDTSRHHPRGRWHAASRPPRGPGPRQGDGDDRPADPT